MSVSAYVRFRQTIPVYLQEYADVMFFPLEISLDDAMELRVINRNFYLQNYAAKSISITFDEMIKSRNALELDAQLKQRGVHAPLREIAICKWVLQYVSICYL